MHDLILHLYLPNFATLSSLLAHTICFCSPFQEDMFMLVRTKRRSNNSVKGKPKYLESNLYQCHCDHHIIHVDWPRNRTRVSLIHGTRLTAEESDEFEDWNLYILCTKIRILPHTAQATSLLQKLIR